MEDGDRYCHSSAVLRVSDLIRFTQDYLINHQLLESPVLLLVQYLRHPPFGQLERLRNLNDSLALYEVYHSHE